MKSSPLPPLLLTLHSCLAFALLLAVLTPAAAQVTQTIVFRKTPYTVFIADLTKTRVQMHWKDEKGRRFSSLKHLHARAEKKAQTLLFATNAGIFDKARRPLGLHIEEGRMIVPLNRKGGAGNFFLKPNGVFFISEEGAFIRKTQDYSAAPSIRSATQSGPLLLLNGRIHPAFNEGSENRLLRSGVGLISPSKLVFAIAEEPVNFFDFAKMFQKKFACEDALYLDGVISRFFIAGDREHSGTGYEEFAALIGVYAREKKGLAKKPADS